MQKTPIWCLFLLQFHHFFATIKPRKAVTIMEKYAWKAKIVDGALEEYIKRHDAIWDEMKEVLSNAGIVNYTNFKCTPARLRKE